MRQDMPQLGGGQSKNLSTNEPSLPIAMEERHIGGKVIASVWIPVNQDRPEFVQGHRYYGGAAWDDRGLWISIIDASVGLLVDCTRFDNASWEIHQIRIFQVAQYWDVSLMRVDVGAMHEPFIDSLRWMGLPVYRGDVFTHDKKRMLVGHTLASMQERQLCVYPKPEVLRALRNVRVDEDRIGRVVLRSAYPDDEWMFWSVVLAWELASTPRLQIGISY